MIQKETRLKVADNTGAKEILVIHIIGGSRQRYGYVGDIVIGTIKSAAPHSTVKKSEIVKAVIVRASKEWRRSDGSSIRFAIMPWSSSMLTVLTRAELVSLARYHVSFEKKDL